MAQMNGGEGPNSYAKNSSYQRGIVDAAASLIEQEIATKLDVHHISSVSPNEFRIADFGSSTGHNSFHAIQTIIEAIKKKYETSGLTSEIPDFFVFFNDRVENDFNTLFNSLPPERIYHAVGLPGLFHGRLLPRASLHFAYSSTALHWLSKVPEEVMNRTSPAWNKGKIHCFGARKEIRDAYLNQLTTDIGSFLEGRAEEMVVGGLMVLLVIGVPDSWDDETSYTILTEESILESSILQMAEEGMINETNVDSFNIPSYLAAPQEIKHIVEKNQSFTIERFEVLENPGKYNMPNARARVGYFRAATEGMLSNHFGNEIVDELFERYTKKLEASPLFSEPSNDRSIFSFVVLKRKAY